MEGHILLGTERPSPLRSLREDQHDSLRDLALVPCWPGHFRGPVASLHWLLQRMISEGGGTDSRHSRSPCQRLWWPGDSSLHRGNIVKAGPNYSCSRLLESLTTSPKDGNNFINLNQKPSIHYSDLSHKSFILSSRPRFVNLDIIEIWGLGNCFVWEGLPCMLRCVMASLILLAGL